MPIQIITDTVKVLLIDQDKSVFQISLLTILPTLVSIIVVLLTAWFSIGAIKKTAEANRVSNIHHELFDCLSKTCKPLSEMIRLLEEVALGIVYTSDGNIKETAYYIFKKRIDNLKNEYNSQFSQHE